MIFVTGDTHGTKNGCQDSLKLFSEKFLPGELLKKGNYLIVTGDFGFVWNENYESEIRKLSQIFKSTILFVDGNNDNTEILNSLPVTKWNGGNVHMLAPNIIHLMRGEVFEIEGKTILALGGADSYDRPLGMENDMPRRSHPIYRTYNKNWWPGERLTEEQLQNAFTNLKRYNNKVDFVITHEIDTPTLLEHFYWNDPCYTDRRLERLDKVIDFRQWFFGHHHYDKEVEPCKRVMFESFENLNDKKFEKFRSEKTFVLPRQEEKE